MIALPSDPGGVLDWVGTHLDGLWSGGLSASGRFAGGRSRAEEALAAYDVAGYAGARNQVWPVSARGASGLSPYIRHGLLTLPEVWDAVRGGPSRDVAKFRDELLWQEYARHLYARLGPGLGRPLRAAPPPPPPTSGDPTSGDPAPGALARADPWPAEMACMEQTVGELERDGWLVNQTRMWLASQWSVRTGADWRDGEDRFFVHLLDGSRAANRVGWQWTVGTATGRPYGFSRQQVEKRAPGLCPSCTLRRSCPIQAWPARYVPDRIDPDPSLRSDPTPGATAGPVAVEEHGATAPDGVWLTAESLGDTDPALAARPGLPAVFVFDAPLLTRLQLSAKRLVFLVESLVDLAGRRPVEVHVGDPATVLGDRPLAATFTPVPGWRRLRERASVVEVHPWPWLVRPGPGPLTSFSAWRSSTGTVRRI
jgi:deoxyribodipyrimidine photo-lyase